MSPVSIRGNAYQGEVEKLWAAVDLLCRANLEQKRWAAKTILESIKEDSDA